MKNNKRLWIGAGLLATTIASSTILGLSNSISESTTTKSISQDAVVSRTGDTEAYIYTIQPSNLGSINYNNSVSALSTFRVGVNSTSSSGQWTNGMLEINSGKVRLIASNSTSDFRRVISDTAYVSQNMYELVTTDKFLSNSDNWYNGIFLRRLNIDGTLDYTEYLYDMYNYDTSNSSYYNWNKIYSQSGTASPAYLHESHSNDENVQLMDVNIVNNKPVAVGINLGMHSTSGQWSRLKYTTGSGWTDDSPYVYGQYNLYTVHDKDTDLVCYTVYPQSFGRSDDGTKYYSGSSSFSASDLTFSGSAVSDAATMLPSTYLKAHQTDLASKISISTSNGYPGMINEGLQLVANDSTGEIILKWVPKTYLKNGLAMTYSGGGVSKVILSGFNAKQPTSWVNATNATLSITGFAGVDAIKSKKAPQIVAEDIQTIVYNNKAQFYKYLPTGWTKDNIIVELGERNNLEGSIYVTIKTNKKQDSSANPVDITNAADYVGGTVKLTGFATMTATKWLNKTEVRMSDLTKGNAADLRTKNLNQVTNPDLTDLIFANIDYFYSGLPLEVTKEQVVVVPGEKNVQAGTINITIQLMKIVNDKGQEVTVTDPTSAVVGSFVLKGFATVDTSIEHSDIGLNAGISDVVANAVTPEQLAKAIFAKGFIQEAHDLTEADVSVSALKPNENERYIICNVTVSNSKAYQGGRPIATQTFYDIKFIGFKDIVRTPSFIQPGAADYIKSLLPAKYDVDIEQEIPTLNDQILNTLQTPANLDKIAGNISINGYTSTATRVSLRRQSKDTGTFAADITITNWAFDPGLGNAGYIERVVTLVFDVKHFSGIVTESDIMDGDKVKINYGDVWTKANVSNLSYDDAKNQYKICLAKEIYQSIISNSSIPTVVQKQLVNANVPSTNPALGDVELTIYNGINVDLTNPYNKLLTVDTDLSGLSKYTPGFQYQSLDYQDANFKNYKKDWSILWGIIGAGIFVTILFISLVVTKCLRKNTRERNSLIAPK